MCVEPFCRYVCASACVFCCSAGVCVLRVSVCVSVCAFSCFVYAFGADVVLCAVEHAQLSLSLPLPLELRLIAVQPCCVWERI